MSIDKINEFKSSILDEVYRHQGFLTAVSSVADSYDEEKNAQLSELIHEQQKAINKSLGLVYAFFRTINSFDAKEEQIKQLVGNDLDNAFAIEGEIDVVSAGLQAEVPVEDASVFDNQAADIPANDTPVVDVQTETEPVIENNPSDLFATTEMVTSDNSVVSQPVDVVSAPSEVNSEVSPVSEVVDNTVVPVEETPVADTNVASAEVNSVPVADVNIVAPDTPAPVDSAVTEFVLSPIEEGVAPENSDAVAVDEANAAVENVSVTEASAPIVEPVQVVPTQEVTTDAVAVENQVAPATVADVASTSDVALVSEVAPTVDVQTAQVSTSYVRKTAQPPKAILVTVTQKDKLSASKNDQVALLNSASVSQEEVVASDVPAVDSQQNVQDLMNKASQAYAEGKTEEAQMYMNQVSELNKQNLVEQSEGGVTLVKK